jgi:hypothetical protein
MPHDMLQTALGALLPLAASTDASALACALDRLADLALAHGRAKYAEHLTQRATRLRETAQ